MDQRKWKCEESGENVLDLKCEKVQEKSNQLFPSVVGNKNLELETPKKTNEPLRTKGGGVQHLQEHQAMVELFDSMTCSLRLLALRKRSPTFQNISTQVEVLAKRKFSCRHLAQMKYILPEAITIEKILVHNKKTLCMEPDMKIALLFDIIDGHCQQSDFIALSQLFASRLVKFFALHPEACDIPQATLPEPFCERSRTISEDKAAEVPEALERTCGNSQTIAPDQSHVVSLESLPISNETDLLPSSSLLHPSFSRHFSQKVVAAETEKDKFSTSPASLPSLGSDNLDHQVVRIWESEEGPGDALTNKDIESEQRNKIPDADSESTVPDTPSQLITPQYLVTSDACESPLQKPVSFADSSMIETPAQLTPTRSMPSCDTKLKAATIQNCRHSYKPKPKRTLDFPQLEGDRTALDSLGVETDNCSVVYDDIPQALVTEGSIEEGNIIGSPALLEKVEGSLDSLAVDFKMSQSSGLVVNHDRYVCLPDLVALIHHIFQSVNCSSITKQELVHKIIINNLDIVEGGEVEYQIELLEKLVPEWICRKLAPSGDIMYNIKKVSDLASIQERVIST